MKTGKDDENARRKFAENANTEDGVICKGGWM